MAKGSLRGKWPIWNKNCSRADSKAEGGGRKMGRVEGRGFSYQGKSVRVDKKDKRETD